MARAKARTVGDAASAESAAVVPWTELVTMNGRGGITLPRHVRDHMAADSPVVRMSEVGPGQFMLEIVQVIAAADRWFHAPEWQAKEREADADIAARRYKELPASGLRGANDR